MILESKDILKLLPHRYPFLLIDKITELEPGKRVVGLKNVTLNEHFFAGHFPDHPIMPGVLILEMMAQAGGVLLLTSDEIEDQQRKLVYLAGVSKARFRKPVLPGDTIFAEIIMQRTRNNIGWAKAVARVDNKPVCEAEMSFALVDRDAASGEGVSSHFLANGRDDSVDF